ncbi:hypothetical protein CQJ30_11150 [Caldibacillus thermoamylovorans]|nr:hypothetical protein CQJ30_11150 [Caldibacillus thermoamylovorans]
MNMVMTVYVQKIGFVYTGFVKSFTQPYWLLKSGCIFSSKKILMKSLAGIKISSGLSSYFLKERECHASHSFIFILYNCYFNDVLFYGFSRRNYEGIVLVLMTVVSKLKNRYFH